MLKYRFLIIISSLFIISGCGSSKKSVNPTSRIIIVDDGSPAVANTQHPSGSLPVSGNEKSKKYDPIQTKYARYLNVTPDQITNLKLYRFIDKWMSTPYLWGGTTENGIDCSAFVQKLIDDVYQVNMPRTSYEQFYANWIELFGSKDYLSEGDVIFFKTIPGTLVSHIGFYLKNGMFVNSSSSKGVSIASLDLPYWKKKYVASGRIKSSVLARYKR